MHSEQQGGHPPGGPIGSEPTDAGSAVWELDVLGAPYERRTIPLGRDDEGEVVATLVRRRVASGADAAGNGGAPAGRTPTSRRATLYVHGFVDYFFQTHLADFAVERGFDFYALDLRKCGRSLLPHQTPFFCRDIREYFPELDEAVRLIREEDGHDVLVLNGHSAGGLTTSLWAHRVRGRGLVDGLVLNSPFFEFYAPKLVKIAALGVVRVIGRRRPYVPLLPNPTHNYGASIHRDHRGEWEFDLNWKPLTGVPLHTGWLRAIRAAHRRLQAGLEVDVPVLVMASARSFPGGSGKWRDEVLTTDSVLDVEHIAGHAHRLGPHVTVVRIEGGLHDLLLSPEQVRGKTFTALDHWLAYCLATGPATG